MSAARDRLEALEFAPLAIGVLALVVATAFGWNDRLLDAIVNPPALVRLGLAVASLIVVLSGSHSM